jgi:hypothetical protein
LRTDSVWPGIFLHASHNLWMESIFFPLTAEGAETRWVAGDLGFAFVVVAAVVAVGVLAHAQRTDRGCVICAVSLRHSIFHHDGPNLRQSLETARL